MTFYDAALLNRVGTACGLAPVTMATGERVGLLTSYVISFACDFKFHLYMKSACKSLPHVANG